MPPRVIRTLERGALAPSPDEAPPPSAVELDDVERAHEPRSAESLGARGLPHVISYNAIVLLTGLTAWWLTDSWYSVVIAVLAASAVALGLETILLLLWPAAARRLFADLQGGWLYAGAVAVSLTLGIAIAIFV